MVLIGLGVLIGYGAWAYVQLPGQPGSGQASGASASYGAPARGIEPLRIEEAILRAEGSPEPTVTLQGEVVDMGPTMGCWLLVKDGTGEVLVQTDPMVYMPQELRGATMKATGTFIYGRFGGMGYSNREGWFLVSPGVEVVEGS
jgi:hypothetical protein